MDTFFILGTLIERDFKVDPSGIHYLLQIFPVRVEELKKKRAKFPEKFQILAVTKGIHVQGCAFSKKVTVHLPLENIENVDKIRDDIDDEYLLFHVEGDIVTHLRDQKLEMRNETIVTKVDKFSRYISERNRERERERILMAKYFLAHLS